MNRELGVRHKNLKFSKHNNIFIIPVNEVVCFFYYEIEDHMIRIGYNACPLCIPLESIHYCIPVCVGDKIHLQDVYGDNEVVDGYWIKIQESTIDKAILLIADVIQRYSAHMVELMDMDAFCSELSVRYGRMTRKPLFWIYTYLLLNDEKGRSALDDEIAFLENYTIGRPSYVDIDFKNYCFIRSVLDDRKAMIAQMQSWAIETVSRYKLRNCFDENCFLKYM